MRLEPAVWWMISGDARDPLDARVIPLLRAIAEHASLRAGARQLGVSYRAAWGVLRDCEVRFGVPLARLERGVGASLAPVGEALLRADDAASRRLASGSSLALELGAPRQRALRPIRISASHDIALAQLRDALPASGALRLELAFTGSLDALAAYARGEADLAGFHLCVPAPEGARAAPFKRLLDARRDRLIAFADRDQGLILPPGNPRRVRSLADVAARGLRFLNRQPGSGTRLLVDALLAQSRIAPAAIRGYEAVERNHVAIAGAVASGAADAGFGLRAAAAEFGLAFVPLARERYLFAVRAKALETPEVRAFLELLRGPLTQRAMKSLPGYAAREAGTVLPVRALGDSGRATATSCRPRL